MGIGCWFRQAVQRQTTVESQMTWKSSLGLCFSWCLLLRCIICIKFCQMGLKKVDTIPIWREFVFFFFLDKRRRDSIQKRERERDKRQTDNDAADTFPTRMHSKTIAYGGWHTLGSIPLTKLIPTNRRCGSILRASAVGCQFFEGTALYATFIMDTSCGPVEQLITEELMCFLACNERPG